MDRAAAHVLARAGAHTLLDFVPYGYDDRQYCSPGFDLPVGCLTRTPNGHFPEYHTSADNLGFVTSQALEDSLAKAFAIIEILEHNLAWVNLSPKGEPQLGRRGLYKNTGGTSPADFEMALLWVLNFSAVAIRIGHAELRLPLASFRRARSLASCGALVANL